MFTVAYKSKAKVGFALTDIKNMLLKAKTDNRANDISGCLIYHKDTFVQIFEGPDEVVKALYKNIKNDNRHFDIETLVEREVDQKLWSDWAMAFYAMPSEDDGLNYKRLLLENHFNSAKTTSDTAPIFKLFKKEAQELLQ